MTIQNNPVRHQDFPAPLWQAAHQRDLGACHMNRREFIGPPGSSSGAGARTTRADRIEDRRS
jgi:hypothetical protein